MFTAISLRLAVCGLALTAAAQDLRFGGPVSGFVFDAPSRSIRQVIGMAGAARLGTPALTELDWASVAPNGTTIIAVSQGETRLYSATNLAEGSAGLAIGDVLESPQLSVWAPDSSAVAIYSASARSLQWIRFTDQSATAEPAIPITGIEGEVFALAANSSSGLMVFSVSGSGVYRATTDGIAPISAGTDASAIALDPSGHTLWIADRGNAQLLQVADPASTSEPQVLLADADRLTDVSALGLASDGKSIYLANRSTLRIYALSRETNEISDAAELDAPATAFTPLTRASFFLLGQRSKSEDPFYVMDESAGRAIFFIPAGEAQ